MDAARHSDSSLLTLADRLADATSVHDILAIVCELADGAALLIAGRNGLLEVIAEQDLGDTAELAAAASRLDVAGQPITLGDGSIRLLGLERRGQRVGALALRSSGPAPEPLLVSTLSRHTAAALERILSLESTHRAPEYLDAVLDHTPNVAIQAYDIDGRVVWWNRAGERIFGISAADAVGKTLDDVLPSAEGARTFEATLRRIDETGEPAGPTEWGFRRPDGSTGFVYSTIFPVATRDGVKRFICMDVDVTARKRAEQALLESQARLRQAQKLEAVGRLAGGVAHDFNNMLGAVLGNAELLAAKLPQGDTTREHAIEIIDVVQHASTLTRRLLAFSRKQPMAHRAVDLNALLGGMLPMLARLIGEHIQVQTSLEAQLWPVNGDPSLLEQVLLNLCVNARDAMPRGGVLAISTRNRTFRDEQDSIWDVARGDWVELSVADDGEGMSEDVRERLFEPFFTTKPEGTGSGLGLATAYWIVNQSNGHIRVSSEPSSGATFSVLLPRTDHAVAPTVAPSHRDPPRAGSGQVILVVENEPSVRRALSDTLKLHGYFVVEADDGLTAKGILTVRRDVQLVVTDVRMPHVSGLELAAATPTLPFVFVSAQADDRPTQPARRRHWIQKPYSAESLLHAVDAALSESGSSGET